MQRKEIKTDMAPKAIGPYSQAVQIGRHIYLSGQIPIEPMTGEVVPGDIKIQTRQVLRNLQMVLAEAGGGLKDIVKTTVFLKDLSRFADMNGVYGEFFTPPYPARATVEVSALPKGVEVEIDAIAVIEDEG
ncbi:MAG: RidA family protein [Deltaproteobacteria bacterium]|nr:RidA family protein [Deltaproteobacteria bacterium]MBI4948877.1 RidA family protein [Deltaproteobacteria bacterium]